MSTDVGKDVNLSVTVACFYFLYRMDDFIIVLRDVNQTKTMSHPLTDLQTCSAALLLYVCV